MTAEEIFAGESENVEFKSEISAKNEKYMKTVVAFANGKAIIVVEIIPGMQRPYYIKSQGILDGTYIRVAGTTRHAERYRVQELILEGTNRSYDQLEQQQTVSEEDILAFCERMYQHALNLTDPDAKK